MRGRGGEEGSKEGEGERMRGRGREEGREEGDERERG